MRTWLHQTWPAVALTTALILCLERRPVSSQSPELPTSPKFEELKTAAETGDPNAQTRLADFYAGTLDSTNAVVWFRKAAEAGHPRAQWQLARFYDFGASPVSIDRPAAIALYIKSAGQGYINAQLDLGQIFERGITGQPDYVESYKWFSLASAQNSPLARMACERITLKLSQQELEEARARVESFVAANPIAAQPATSSDHGQPLPAPVSPKEPVPMVLTEGIVTQKPSQPAATAPPVVASKANETPAPIPSLAVSVSEPAACNSVALGQDMLLPTVVNMSGPVPLALVQQELEPQKPSQPATTAPLVIPSKSDVPPAQIPGLRATKSLPIQGGNPPIQAAHLPTLDAKPERVVIARTTDSELRKPRLTLARGEGLAKKELDDSPAPLKSPALSNFQPAQPKPRANQSSRLPDFATAAEPDSVPPAQLRARPSKPASQALPVLDPTIASKLQLKGISAFGNRRVASINNRNLFNGEEANLAFDGKSVRIRCLEIKAYSAMVLVEGTSRPVELKLVR